MTGMPHKNELAWFKKYATKKTVRGELGKPNGFPTRRQAQGERKKTSSAYFLDYYQMSFKCIVQVVTIVYVYEELPCN
ncbi:Uncharacterised protein [Moraxella caprae]|uniref:Uncharacterized protein n=1 Tax=Moraxella caprae TaxID=90240 RepID=A0A378U563_9GAMM|nr:Uncharacterised protein [Moraxella caprae]STZ09678.1 Uncharacterised protein [Moraxella caprae]STZ70256.1 Uncharacterised protein [Moraxella caprae]